MLNVYFVIQCIFRYTHAGSILYVQDRSCTYRIDPVIINAIYAQCIFRYTMYILLYTCRIDPVCAGSILHIQFGLPLRLELGLGLGLGLMLGLGCQDRSCNL